MQRKRTHASDGGDIDDASFAPQDHPFTEYDASDICPALIYPDHSVPFLKREILGSFGELRHASAVDEDFDSAKGRLYFRGQVVHSTIISNITLETAAANFVR